VWTAAVVGTAAVVIQMMVSNKKRTWVQVSANLTMDW
jgi:hypothetical protein